MFSFMWSKVFVPSGKGTQKRENNANIGKQNVKRGVTSVLLTQ